MPKQNPITRLEAVAAGLGQLASELEKLYGEPAPNLRYWRNEIISVVDELMNAATLSDDSGHQAARG